MATPNNSNKFGTKWQADKALESLRLSSSHRGWNLAGSSAPLSRTRNGGRRQQVSHSSSEDESSYSYETDSDSDLSGYVSDSVMEKPPTNRVILEVASLKKAFEDNSVCPLCKSKVEIAVDSVCLASSISLSCSNQLCGYIYHGDPPAKANIRVRNFPFDNRERNTDYAINIIYVLGILSVGDGCVEAARLCGLLSLPRDTTMEKRSFPVIEERIGPAMRELSQEILLLSQIPKFYKT